MLRAFYNWNKNNKSGNNKLFILVSRYLAQKYLMGNRKGSTLISQLF